MHTKPLKKIYLGHVASYFRVSLIFFLSIATIKGTLGQTIIKPDKDGSISKGVPFDQHFIIELDDPDNSIDKFDVLRKFKVDGVYLDEKKRTIAFVLPQSWKVRYAPSIQKRTAAESDGKKTKLLIKPLAPNRHFEVVLRRKFKGKMLDKMMDVIYEFYQDDYNSNGDPLSDSEKRKDSLGRKAIEKLSTEIEPKLPDGNSQSAIGDIWLSDLTYDENLYDFFEGPVAILEQSMRRSLYDHYIPRTSALNESNFSRAASIQLKFKKSGILLYEFNTNFNSDESRMKIYHGMNSIAGEEVKIHELTKRLDNIKTSIGKFDTLSTQLNLVKLHNDTGTNDDFDSMIEEIVKIRSVLDTNQNRLNKQINEISKLLDGEENMRYSTYFSGSNAATNMKTLGSRLIVPIIGLAVIPTDVKGTLFFKPFAGASIHFRQINKDLPLRELSHTFLHRSSLLLGVTASKIEDETKEYFDLNAKTSLIVGYNFKVSHAFGLTYGGVLMKRADPNPTIVKRQTIVNHYVALTFDVDLVSNLSKVTSKFGL